MVRSGPGRFGPGQSSIGPGPTRHNHRVFGWTEPDRTGPRPKVTKTSNQGPNRNMFGLVWSGMLTPNLILDHEGSYDTRDKKIAVLRLKFNAFKALKGENVNGTLTRLKCLLNDLENIGVSIYQAKDSDLDVKEDTKSSSKFLADLNDEFHERALLANQKRFYKRFGRVGSAKKPMDKLKETCFACDASESTEELGNQAEPADVRKVHENIIEVNKDYDMATGSGIQSLGYVQLDEFGGADANLDADESSFDMELEIKFIRKDVPNSYIMTLRKDCNRFVSLQKTLAKTINIKVGTSVLRSVRKETKVVSKLLKYCVKQLDKDEVNLCELVNVIRDLVILLDSASASTKAAHEGEKMSTQENIDLEITVPAPAQGEQQPNNTTPEPATAEEAKDDAQGEQSYEQAPPILTALIADKGKSIATEKDLIKQLILLIDQGGSTLKILNLKKFSASGEGQMSIEEAKAQMEEIKRPKREKMLEEYNHYITFRADPLPISKISYKVNNSTKEASMRIIIDNQPLNLTMYDMFVLKMMGLSEWLEVHALASK
nr:hypothetical protein [Tanacetum cinerariifolium]